MYCLRVPLRLPDTHQIGGLDRAVKGSFEGFEVSLEQDGGYPVLKVSGISSEQEAFSFLRTLRAGICWAGLDLKTGISVNWQPQKVAYHKDPKAAAENIGFTRGRVDATIDSMRTAIYPEGIRVAKLTAGSVGVLIRIRPDRFLDTVLRGLELANPDVLEGTSKASERLSTAIELYVHSYFETNTTARFLLQCAALEVLAPPAEAQPIYVYEMIDAWIKDVKAKVSDQSLKETQRREFDRLLSRVEWLRTSSHGQRIQEFARAALASLGETDIEAKIRKLQEAYAVRGRFLHKGSAKKIGEGATTLHDLLPKMLKTTLQAKNPNLTPGA